jgi:CRISPR-associated endonuclease/helicase Cas3
MESGLKLYDYQKKVAQYLHAGKNVILQAPTGAGKTTAAILPYLHAQREDIQIGFPTKCIYVVPMRVLANQFVEEYKKIGASISRRFKQDLQVTIQTGEYPSDRKLEGDLIFCTIDQFLSSYFTMPYGLPNRLANLNAGAMVGAYLVFDEFHLLEPKTTLPSAWYAIKQLSKLAPTLIMTATFSAAMLGRLAEDLQATTILISPQEALQIEKRIPTPRQRQRIWKTASQPLSPDTILETHQQRSLVLCNTVRKAQALYRDLKKIIQEQGLDVHLLMLHSRYIPEDRQRIEQELKRLFGKQEESDSSCSVIAIATQTIEVGVDITSEVLHSELAPASAMIQRAGRCARYPGEQGTVIIYPLETYAPYGKETREGEESPWVEEMKAAFTWLQAHDGESFDFEKEQDLVNAVATPRDAKIIEGLFAGQMSRQEDILRVLLGDRKTADNRLLVRDADSRLVLIHSNPDELLENPKSALGFNLQLSTLFGLYNHWKERGLEMDLDWTVKRLIEAPGDQNEENRSEYGWKEVHEPATLSGARVLVVNPALAGYLPDEGFLPEQGFTDFISTLPVKATEQTWEGFSYLLESYEDHLYWVLKAFQEKAYNEMLHPALALEKAAGWLPGSVIKAAWLACLFHDVGKLSKGWQKWACTYQEEVNHPVEAYFAAAHTDMDRHNPIHKEAARRVQSKSPKPHHAAESALATAAILVRVLEEEELAKAAITAIVRHHTPFADECQVYALEKVAQEHVVTTLGYIPQEIRKAIDLTRIRAILSAPQSLAANVLIPPDKGFGWLAYVLIVRALRRADQLGTSWGTGS